MGKISTFYFINFSKFLNSQQIDDVEIESFNYLFDNGLIKQKSPAKKMINSLLDFSRVFVTKQSENLEYVEFAKN